MKYTIILVVNNDLKVNFESMKENYETQIQTLSDKLIEIMTENSRK